MKLIILGAPGAGKGTIAKRVMQDYKIPHISTGDLFRENVKNNTELGIKAKEYMDRGALVPDDIVIAMVEERLKQGDCKNGYILDGFPRTIAQAEALGKAEQIDKVLDFQARNDVIIQRISGRRTCRQCEAIFHIINLPPKVEGKCDYCGGELFQRDDDKPETIRQRLGEYNEKTAPLIEYYEKEGLVSHIDANSTPDEIYDSVAKVLSK